MLRSKILKNLSLLGTNYITSLLIILIKKEIIPPAASLKKKKNITQNRIKRKNISTTTYY